MGPSSSCHVFEAFSSSLEWISVLRFGAFRVLHILDDFSFHCAYRRAMPHRFKKFSSYVWFSRCAHCSAKNLWSISSHLRVSHSIQLIRKLVCRKISFKNAACHLNPFANVVKLPCENCSSKEKSDGWIGVILRSRFNIGFGQKATSP